MEHRRASVKRHTRETSIEISVDLDRTGPVRIDSSIPFMDHMFEVMAHHGGFALKLKASGTVFIDGHHLVEDLGIVLGQAFKKALGPKRGIGRYGNFLLPMDEALSYVAIDLSGRPFLDYEVTFRPQRSGFDYELLKEFFYAFAVNAGITLHISMIKGTNCHHIAESVFKGVGRAMRDAVRLNPGSRRVPSTKGRL